MDNKTLIENIAAECGRRKDDVQGILADAFTIIADALVEMDTVVIPTFGQFESKKRKERITVHPSSGRRLLVPPKVVVGFRPSAILKSKVRDY